MTEILFDLLKYGILGFLLSALIVVVVRMAAEEWHRVAAEYRLKESSWGNKKPGKYFSYHRFNEQPTTEEILDFEILSSGIILITHVDGIKEQISAGTPWECHSVPIGMDDDYDDE